MTKPFIVGFMGYAGVGKTTACQILKTLSNVDIEITSYAGPLKQAVQQLFLFSDEQIYGTKEEKEKVDHRWGISPRRVLQIVGTDCLRNMIDEQFHVKRMEAYISACESPVLLIDDVRFEGEAELINHYGGTCIQIQRPGYPKEAVRHASEYPPTHLASGYFILNDGDLEHYKRQLLGNLSWLKHKIMEVINEAC